jgi:hypothetical protein
MVRRTRRRSAPSFRVGLLELLVVLQTAIPALQMVPGLRGLRAAVRAVTYFTGFTGFAAPRSLLLDRRSRHPASIVALVISVYLVVLVGGSEHRLSAIAECVLVVSVLAPVWWAPGLVREPAQLHRLLWLILLASGLNSLVGVLQVYNPERWMPQVFSSQITDLSMYRYTGAEGRMIIRPCGLYDTPGAVSAPGAWAALTGFALFQQERSLFRRTVAIAAAFVGVAAIYFTLVRTAFVIVIVGVACYSGLLILRRREAQAASLVSTVAVTLATAMLFAAVLGGTRVTDRFMSLFKAPPTAIYYHSRGAQYESVVWNDLLENPMGVGLGSWGMVPAHFGGGGRFAELQLHGWGLDGGWPLVALYSLAVAIALCHDFNFCMRTRSPQVFQWAACIMAVNVSTAMTVLSFVPFNTQIGMQFWLLTGVLRGTSLLEQRRQRATKQRRTSAKH